MLLHQMVAPRVEEHWETPRVSEGYQMTLSWKEFGIQNAEHGNLAPSHFVLVDAVAEFWVQEGGPNEEGTPVLPFLEIRHDSIDDVRVWSEEI